MYLSHLLKDILPLPATAERSFIRLQLDSRKVERGDLFLAIKGSASDGRKYIPEAIARGASAVLLDANESGEAVTFHGDIPIILVHDLKNQLGPLSAHFHDYPAKKLHMIGVTGTNGKTSCTHFIAQALEHSCGIIGTLGSGIYGKLGEAGLTTPDAITLQATLQELLSLGANTVAMEVSSHSIDQGRIKGIPFETGIFTNLTQDHLDYHGTIEAYADVKKRFLTENFTRQVVINADDLHGEKWLEILEHLKPTYAYSTSKRNVNVPLVYVDDLTSSLQGMIAKIHSPWGEGKFYTSLIGKFNLSNVLAVFTTLCLNGVPFKEALERLELLQPVPGRMQTLTSPGMPLVVVDYAHTPDALEKVLESLRAHIKGKLICVFGCGGDRDAAKRPIMAKIAEQLADKVIVTNDNPRSEKPEEIARQIKAECSKA